MFYIPLKDLPSQTVVLETDLGGDVDDVGALALLLDGAKKYGFRVGGVSLNRNAPGIVEGVRALLCSRGFAHVPIATAVEAMESTSSYLDAMVPFLPAGADLSCGSAMEFYQKLFSEAEDGSVTVISIGFLQNLDFVWREMPALFGKKVRSVVIMGGSFRFDPDYREYNFTAENHEAQTADFIANYPGQAIYAGFEAGYRVWTDVSPKKYIPDPLIEAYRAFGSQPGLIPYKRESWDPVTVDFALYGEGDRYRLSAPISLHLEDGKTRFAEATDGKAAYVILNRPEEEISGHISRAILDTVPAGADSRLHSIERAEAYIQTHKDAVNPAYRPLYHAAAPCGWINDPNGFCYFKGKYHLFFQYNPYSAEWDAMHWGHWTSSDLVKWDWCGVILAPDMPYDNYGCFSGHAIVKDDTLYLFYTGVRYGRGNTHPQQQCLAMSKDGIHFTKYEGNPIIPASLLPEGNSDLDFRDPKVYRDGDKYSMLVASRGPKGGDVLKFQSRDLIHWEYQSKHIEGLCPMVECPDYFVQNGHSVTVVSVIDMPPSGLRYPGTHPVLGLMDVEQGHPTETVLDHGFDFYAPETVETADGRHIMIGWMHSFPDDFAPRYLNHNWNNMMTLPRELYVQDGEILQRPARELEAYRGKETSLRGNSISCALPRACEISVDIQLHTAQKIQIQAAQSENEFFAVEYEPREQIIRIDRSKAGYGFGKDGANEKNPRREALLSAPNGRLGLRIFLDKSSCEIFSKNGRLVMSSLICPRGSADGFRCTSDDGSAEFTVTAWEHRNH